MLGSTTISVASTWPVLVRTAPTITLEPLTTDATVAGAVLLTVAPVVVIFVTFPPFSKVIVVASAEVTFVPMRAVAARTMTTFAVVNEPARR